MTAAVSAERDPIFVGVPQDGITLGDSAAPATLVEYADLQCPSPATFSRDVLPAVVAQYVRSGRPGWSSAGSPSSAPTPAHGAPRGARRGRARSAPDVARASSSARASENAGWVTDELLGAP